MSENQVSKVIEAKEIMTLLPHRYPFLLVDRVLDYKEGEWLKAIKNISVNEPCFTGHFPSEPILPGVLSVNFLNILKAKFTTSLSASIEGSPKYSHPNCLHCIIPSPFFLFL